MRTTLNRDDKLLTDAERFAAESGRTLAAVFEDALRESLARRAGTPGRKPIKFPTTGRGGLKRGTDLDDSADLLDRMER